MDLARSLGIIFVVTGHYYVPRCLFLPVRSFHISLFFFISGYFFKEKSNLKQKIHQSVKRVRSLLVPYFAYNCIFAIVTALLHTYSTTLRLGEYPTVHNFFVRPFLDAHQYLLFLPGWFVPLLFLVEILHLFVYNNANSRWRIDALYLGSYLCLALGSVLWSFSGVASRWKFVFIRVSFSLFFFFVGFIYHRYLERLCQAKADRPISFVIAFMILSLLDTFYNENLSYYIAWAEFPARVVWLPIVTGLCGIYITLFISKLLSKHLTEHTDILYQIGQETYHIMSLHLSVFLLLNMILVYVILPDQKPEVLNDIWFKYKPALTWPIFISCGIMVPTWLASLIRRSIKRYCGFDKLFKRVQQG